MKSEDDRNEQYKAWKHGFTTVEAFRGAKISAETEKELEKIKQKQYEKTREIVDRRYKEEVK